MQPCLSERSPCAPRAGRSREWPAPRGSARRSRARRGLPVRAAGREGYPGPARIDGHRVPPGRAGGSRRSGIGRQIASDPRPYDAVLRPRGSGGRRGRSGFRAAGCASSANWPMRRCRRPTPLPGGPQAPAKRPRRAGAAHSPAPAPRPRPAGPGSAGRRETVSGHRAAPRPWHTRRPGSLRRHFRQIVSRSRGSPGRSDRRGTGSVSRTSRNVSAWVSPRKGGRPVRTS